MAGSLSAITGRFSRRRRQWLPTGIVLDYVFAPDHLRGDQAIAFIRKAHALKHCRLIALTKDARDGRKMLDAGADEWIKKPFGLGELKKSLLTLPK